MNENKLPTKSELITALQSACDFINGLGPEKQLKVYERDNGYLSLINSMIVVMSFPYRPDIKAPDKFKLVLVRLCGQIYIRSSSGRMDDHQRGLIGFHDNGTRVLMDNWYCPETGESHNWDDGWTPEEYRNDEKENRSDGL